MTVRKQISYEIDTPESVRTVRVSNAGHFDLGNGPSFSSAELRAFAQGLLEMLDAETPPGQVLVQAPAQVPVQAPAQVPVQAPGQVSVRCREDGTVFVISELGTNLHKSARINRCRQADHIGADDGWDLYDGRAPLGESFRGRARSYAEAEAFVQYGTLPNGR